MITWEDFNITNSNNKKSAFENMCRILFNYHFFNNKAIFKQKFNNPGIEIEPIDYKDKKISFQAKYIESDNIYEQIKKSAEKIVKYYSGKIEVVYLFSNKDLDVDSASYKEIINILKPANIELERICNQEILSIIETNNYKTIKQLFFGKHNLTQDWFEQNLRIALEDLEPRYVSGFNVDTDIQNYFEIKYMSKEVFDMLNHYLTKWKEDLRHININKNLLERIKSKIDGLIVPSALDFAEIFKWFDLFKNEYFEVEKILDKIAQKLNENIESKERTKILEEERGYYKVLKVLEDIDFSKNSLFSSFNSNVLFIEGDAGIGKSHLLGFEAEKHGNIYNRTILLLGQKLIGNNSPLQQIQEQLNTTLDIDSLFDTLEGLGEIDGSNTVIMIDALNESANHTIWKNHLNSLVSKVVKFKHIKLVATIRSTYINQIFSDSIQKKITKNEIYKIKHNGFEGIIDEAITKFFKYYKIPINTLSYLGYSFTNPLFLKIYCKAYENKNEGIGSKSLDEIFNSYISEEEIKIKEKLSIDGNYPYCKKILSNLAEYLYINQTRQIDIEKLFEINTQIPNYDKLIPQMQKSKLLISYIYNNVEYVYFGYERICDFYIAKIIVNSHTNLNDLTKDIAENLLKVNKYNRLEKDNAIGVFSALSILISEKYNEEILPIITTIKINAYDKQQLIEDYLNNLSFRDDSKVNGNSILSILKDVINTQYLMDVFYSTLISLSGRQKNPLNALYLHEKLKDVDLNIRDSSWTIFINQYYNEESQLFHIINYFENKLFVGDYITKKLYAVLLTWVLTSTNRKLRDKVSRCLVNLFKEDYSLMIDILDMFYNVNDAYIIQRLYGIIYGAVLKSQQKSEKLTVLCNKIFSYVFDTNYVYPDILLRDYALNTIEYGLYLNCPLSFDISKCRPPYNSQQIPIIDSSIEEYFAYNGKDFTGANSIKSSLTPNINGGYGDFGRYVFESALTSFDKIDIKNLYLYALYYIKNTLGYKNELFSEYDRSSYMMAGFDRHNTTKIERIGKKYQWIAFYHILALVTDNHKLSQEYSDNISTEYIGSWNPYVRDFDPTLDLINSNRIYDFNLSINQPIYNNWEDSKNWANNKLDVENFKELIFTRDNNTCDWVFLYGHVKAQTSKTYEEDYKEVWRMVGAYIINEDNYIDFINKLKTKPLWGRWFPESSDRYTIFSREYCWSPAYKDEYGDEAFEIEIETGETVKKQRTFPKYDFISGGDKEGESLIFSYLGEEICFYEEHIREKIGVVKPLWNSFLWEESYDAAKEESIGVYFPSKILVDSLNLIQKETGVFYYKNELVAVDFSLIKGNSEGLYIKKQFLDKFLKENKYKIFWIGIGEKNDVKKKGFSIATGSIFNDFCSLVYFVDDKLESVNYFGNRNEHN